MEKYIVYCDGKHAVIEGKEAWSNASFDTEEEAVAYAEAFAGEYDLEWIEEKPGLGLIYTGTRPLVIQIEMEYPE